MIKTKEGTNHDLRAILLEKHFSETSDGMQLGMRAKIESSYRTEIKVSLRRIVRTTNHIFFVSL